MLTLRDAAGTALCSVTVADDGSWTCTPAQRFPAGPLQVVATQTDPSGNSSSVSVSLDVEVVAPTLSINLDLVARGDGQSVTGKGFIPGEQVSGLLQSTPVDLGVQTADASGAVTFAFKIPADFELGEHTITLTGAQSGPVAAQFTVIAQPSNPVPPTVPLSVTGADSTGLVLMVLVLLGLGSALVVARGRGGRRDRFNPRV